MAPRKISRSERIAVSQEEMDLAMRRTDYLLHMTHRSLRDLIANAWVQGVLDAGERTAAREANGTAKP